LPPGIGSIEIAPRPSTLVSAWWNRVTSTGPTGATQPDSSVVASRAATSVVAVERIIGGTFPERGDVGPARDDSGPRALAMQGLPCA